MMKQQILAACLAAWLAASLAACAGTPAVTTETDIAVTEPASAPTETTAETTALTETETEINGFRVNAEKTAFVWTGEVRDGLAAIEAGIAELHPAAGAFAAAFGAVTLEMAVDFMAENERIIEVIAASAGEHRIAFDAPRQTHFASGGVELFAVGGETVLTYTMPFERVENYVFDATGITQLTFSAGATDADCNEPVILLTDGGDSLHFVCWPKKYACGHPNFAYLVGADELLELEGSVTFRDGKFSFGVTTQRTFADLNADGALDYAYFCNTGEDAASLAARMAENAKRFAPFTLSDVAARFSVSVS